MKRIISILFTIILMIPTVSLYVYAEGTESKPSMTKMTLDDLLRHADRLNSINEIKIMNLEKESFEARKKATELKLQNLESELTKLQSESDINKLMPEIYALRKQLGSIEFEISLYENNKTEKAVRNQIKARLVRSYTEFFSTSRQLSIAKLELEYYEYMSGVQKNLYESGKITKNTADIAAIDLMSAKNAVSTYERMLKTAKINIAFTLSCYDETQYSIIAQKPIMETEFKTNPGLVKTDIVKSDDYLVSLFHKANMDLLRLENEIGLEKEYLNNCLSIWEDDSEEAVVQRLLIEQKEMEYEQKKADFTLVVLNSYAEYENLRDKYLFSTEKSKVYEESRRINKVLFSEGRISEQEFRQNDMRYAEEIFSAENDYLALIVAVNDLKLIEQGVLPEG